MRRKPSRHLENLPRLLCNSFNFTIHATWALVHVNESPHKYPLRSKWSCGRVRGRMLKLLLSSNYGWNGTRGLGDWGGWAWGGGSGVVFRRSQIVRFVFPLLQNSYALERLLSIYKFIVRKKSRWWRDGHAVREKDWCVSRVGSYFIATPSPSFKQRGS